jgi:RNA-directed DNA polymerase
VDQLLRALLPLGVVPAFQRVNTYLLRWIRKKYRVGMKQAILRLAEGYALAPRHFAHWALTPPSAGR